MNAGRYFGWNGDYYGLPYYKGPISAMLPEHHDYGPEKRDNEYYAEKYFHIFARIVGMIEHGQLKFDSQHEEDEEWKAACKAMCRYRERMHTYEKRKRNA